MSTQHAYRVTIEVTLPTVDCLTLYFTDFPSPADLAIALGDTVFAAHALVHDAISRHGLPSLSDELTRQELAWSGSDGSPVGWLEVERIILLCPVSRQSELLA